MSFAQGKWLTRVSARAQVLHSKAGGAGFPDKDAMEKIVALVKEKA